MFKTNFKVMVLESLINPLTAEKKPWITFLLGSIYTSIAIVLSLYVFESYASLVMVFLTVMASIPLIYSTINMEEEKDLTLNDEKSILKEHAKALGVFMLLFLGATLTFALWYVFLPPEIGTKLFSVQIETINAINNNVTGNFTAQFAIFTKIFLNNLKVLIFCILFAFVYGVGAMFILVWNASVIGAAMGNMIRGILANYTFAIGFMKIGGYFHAYSIGLLRYLLHGIPEIGAYFVGGLAGGIISIAVIRHDIGTKNFEKIIFDSSDLIIISILILLIAGLLEVFVTPLFF